MRKLLSGILLLNGSAVLLFGYEQVFLGKSVGPIALIGLSLLAGLFFVNLCSYLLLNTQYRHKVINAWLVGASLLGTYVFCDLVAGLILNRPLSPPMIADSFRHHRLAPNSITQFVNREFNYVQRVNNLGLRGRDQEFSKPHGAFRILMLGDSFTMGKGVGDDETFSVLLERALDRRKSFCNGRDVEVLNAGVDSYAPILSLIQLKRELLQLQADLVILNLDMSDLMQESVYRKLATRSPNGELLAVPQEIVDDGNITARLRTWLQQRTYLTRLLLHYLERLLARSDPAGKTILTEAHFSLLAHTLVGQHTVKSTMWIDLFESVNAIRTVAEEHNMMFMLSVYPWGHQVNDKEWMPGRYSFMPRDAIVSDESLMLIKQFAESSKIPLADLFPVFREYDGAQPLFYSHDMHFTAAGHVLMANGLTDFLVSELPIEKCMNTSQ